MAAVWDVYWDEREGSSIERRNIDLLDLAGEYQSDTKIVGCCISQHMLCARLWGHSRVSRAHHELWKEKPPKSPLMLNSVKASVA